MTLSSFIRSDTETILVDWDAFAKESCSPDLSFSELRDHAREMLLAIADDIDTAQSDAEQSAKSKGEETTDAEVETWAEVHGRARQASGFDVNETVSEFRALRASVVSHWTQARTQFSVQDAEDLIRFNEAIDQAVAESLKQYSTHSDMQNRLFRAVLVASPDPIGVLDREKRFLYANEAMARMFDRSCEQMIGRTNAGLELPDAAEFEALLQGVIEQQSGCRAEATHRSFRGEMRRFEYELAPVLDAAGLSEAIVCIARDITERASAEEESRHNAQHDPLTGLPNRRLFLDRLDQAFKHAKRRGLSLALLYIDLDGFKAVNDTLGHEAGDCLLVDVAARLAACLREDDSVARLGGDEFTVILSGATQHRDVELVAQSIIRKMAAPFSLGKKSVRISASIGAALLPEHATSPDELLRAADQAMYQAKRATGSRFCFSGAPHRETAATD
ncbi:MAG: diguanylate cyclase [Pseudoxanthomonas sp.]|nr:diguanylate cyclase [Pseudoxanthomonas sp.]